MPDEWIDPDVSMDDDWIDRHSVTCAICGGMADETETIKWSDMDEPRPGESTARLETVQSLLDHVGDGEAHTQCFEYAERNGVEAALDELQPVIHR